MSVHERFTHRLLSHEHDIRELASEWQVLWNRCPNATTFQRPQWLIPWIEIFLPSTPFLIEIRCNHMLVGIFPLLIYTRGSERVLAIMGGGVSDYLDALIDPYCEREVLAVFLTCIAQEISGWDRLELTDLHRRSTLLKLQNGTTVHPHDVCPALCLGAAEDLRGVVPAHKRANLRNSRNRLTQAGTFRVDLATPANLLPMLESMFRLHASRWQEQGETGVLSDSDVREFHRRAAPALLAQGVLRLYGLFLEDQMIAALYTMFEKDSALLYLHGFNPDYSSYSPGTQVFRAAIEDAIRLGKGSVDFLRGQEPYKYSWGAEDVQTYCLRATNSTFVHTAGEAA